MAAATVEKTWRGPEKWDLEIRDPATGLGIIVHEANKIPVAHLQAVIDGTAPPPGAQPRIRYDAETDRLVFGGTGKSIARALIASELATAVGLRQPPSQDVKPAKT